MSRYSILLVFLVFTFLVTSLPFYAQPYFESKDKHVAPGHALGISSERDASYAIKNERKGDGTSFFSFEWLFNSIPPSKASRVSRSSPPREGGPLTSLFGRREVTYNRSTANFIQNVPSASLQPSIREQRLGKGKLELGVLMGTSHGITDIQANKHLDFVDFVDYQTSNFDYSFGVFTRYMATNWFAVNGGIKYARLSGVNKPPSNIEYEAFSFKNDLFEFFVKTEFHAPFLYHTSSKAYLFTGLSIFFTEISVLDAENQIYQVDDNFEQVQPALPIGLGYSYTFGNYISVGYEFGWRYTPFHYLDGVSPHDERRYDSYFFNLITLSYPLNLDKW